MSVTLAVQSPQANIKMKRSGLHNSVDPSNLCVRARMNVPVCEWITYTCICFLMAYNVRPCVKELSATPQLSQPTWIQKRSVELGNTSKGFLPPHSLTHPLPLFSSTTVSLTVCVRISKVVFQCCIVAGYYRSNTTQGTEALWVLEQLRAEEQMSSPLPVSLSMPHAGPVGIQPS